MALEPVRHRFSLEQYEAMAEAGVLGEDDRLELIEGEILEMAAKSTDHMVSVTGLARALIEAVGDRGVVSVQDPVRLPPDSEPEPDVVVARPPLAQYLEHHPEPDDILLVVEVARASLAFDRGRKVPLYARHGINEVWLVDLEAGRVEVYRDPGPARDEAVEAVDRDGVLAPLAFADVRIPAAIALPQRGR